MPPRVAMLMAFALALASVPAGAEQPRFGSTSVTRLWLATPDGPTPACTAAYLRVAAGPAAGVWLVTARHCVEGGGWRLGRERPGPRVELARETRPGRLAPGQIVLVGALGVAPAGDRPAESLPLAEAAPRAGGAWIHGFPFGVEHITSGRVLGDSDALEGTLEVKVVPGPVTEAGPGFSGAPVVGRDGRVIGVLQALRGDADGGMTAFVTPVETVRRVLGGLAASAER